LRPSEGRSIEKGGVNAEKTKKKCGQVGGGKSDKNPHYEEQKGRLKSKERRSSSRKTEENEDTWRRNPIEVKLAKKLLHGGGGRKRAKKIRRVEAGKGVNELTRAFFWRA